MTDKEKIKKLEERVAELEEMLCQLQKLAFGRKSERKPSSSTGCEGTNLDAKDQAQIDAARDMQKKARATLRELDEKLRLGRKKDRTCVESENVRVVVPRGMNCSACHGPVKDLGLAHTAQEIDYIPARIIEREYRLHRAECQCGKVAFVMPPPKRALEKCNYSADLIAWVITQKFRYFFPVNRLEQFLDDHGLYISRQTLNNHVNRAAAAIAPIADRIRELNKNQKIIQIDETTICVVMDKSKKFYLWCTLTQEGIAFSISEHRNTDKAKQALGDQAEAVLSDGLNIYNKAVGDSTHANCLAHLRRMFFNAILSFPVEAMTALNFIVEIYKIEALVKEEGRSQEELRELRNSRSRDLMQQLKSFIETIDAPPRSSLGKAKKYAKKRWKELCAFIDDPRIEVDNNAVEREFKLAKLGLKNFLFCQSEVGCDALANFYTLIATCKLHGTNFEAYLADVLVKIEAGWPQSRLDELLPQNWQQPDDSNDKPEMVLGRLEQKVSLEELIERRNLHKLVYTETHKDAAIEIQSSV